LGKKKKSPQRRRRRHDVGSATGMLLTLVEGRFPFVNRRFETRRNLGRNIGRVVLPSWVKGGKNRGAVR